MGKEPVTIMQSLENIQTHINPIYYFTILQHIQSCAKKTLFSRNFRNWISDRTLSWLLWSFANEVECEACGLMTTNVRLVVLFCCLLCGLAHEALESR